MQSSNSPSRSLLQGGSLSGAMINQRRPKVVDGVRTPMTSHKPNAVKPPPPSSPKEDTTSQQQQTLLLAHLLSALQQQIASSSIGGGSTSAASLLSALEQQVLLTSLLSGSGGDVGGLLSSLTQPPTPSPQVQSGRRTAHHPITQERVVSQGLHHHVVSSSIPRGGPVIVEDSEGEEEDIVNLSLKSPSNKRFKSASPRNPPVILEDPSTTAQFMEEQQASLVEEKEDFDSMSPPLEPLEPEVVLEVDDSHVWDPEVQDAVTPSPSPFTRVGQNSGNDVLTSGGRNRPYVCDFPGCRWSFKRQYHLDRHLLTHKTGGGGNNGINVNNKRPFSDEEEVIGGGVEEGDSDVEVVPIKEERNKQPVQPVVQQQQRKLSAARAVAPPSSTVTSAPSNLTRTPTASSSSLSTPVMINAIHFSPSQGKEQLRQNQNQSQLPATATVQGPIKGSFTCNYPGCGIKCQSQSSFEAHVYLTHIVMNARGRERERNRANAGISKTPNGGNTASPGRAASAHRNNSLINSPFYLELQSKMKQKMMEQKQAKERMRVRQEELQRRYILQQQEERRQRLLAQEQLHQRQKNLMSSNLMLGEVGSSESESERVSSTVRDIHKGNGHHGGMGNQEVDSSTTVVNGEGRDDELSDQSATQQLSFLASILSAVGRQQNQKINSINNYPVQSPVPQRNGPRTSPTVEIPESLSQLERMLSGGGQKAKPMMKVANNQPSASNHNLTNSNVVKCPPGVKTSSESLSFLASLAQKNSQQQQQMQQPFTFLDNSATTLLEGNGNGSSGQHHGSEGTGGGKALFACDIEGCDKKFGRNCELTRHKLNHMDIWPFSCDHPGCGRRFKRKDVFKNHLRTHVKECPSSTSLMSHMSSSNSSPATSSLSSPVG